jgi:hypothetical protein
MFGKVGIAVYDLAIIVKVSFHDADITLMLRRNKNIISTIKSHPELSMN